ncbi:KAP family P-loop NTPase fold protein [Candidatus Magnetaquicoccus inordinatus]|uniref:KAP family P-loop NTPase fold protein n=1 Tax=Candidatus Magnetaquicoccus inordinatus TaxID=2496818 RepID=UPI00187D4680|nr:P-loop NTPase fold protein [Candidatus Magnetaquicoccus inordinatus]
MAKRILQMAVELPCGSVIAIEGGWGRGKTDLLARIASKTYQSQELRFSFHGDRIHPRALWLNPWQYTHPDLLTPLMHKLHKRLPPADTEESIENKKRSLKALAGLAAAGVGIGLKGLSNLYGMGAYYEKVAELVVGALKNTGDTLVDNRFTEEIKKEIFLQDPMEKMAANFNTLVREVLGGEGARLLICVDDLDRCLPARQVALLEAFHFLTATEAPVVFIIAIDPALAEKSVKTHYDVQYFDPRTYLDKIFSFRLSLPSLSDDSIKMMVADWLNRLRQNEIHYVLEWSGETSSEHIVNLFPDVLTTTSLRNPRLVDKLLTRVRYLWAIHEDSGKKIEKGDLALIVRWMAIGERWPEIRLSLQESGHMISRINSIISYYKYGSPNNLSDVRESARMKALPSPSERPEMESICIDDVDRGKHYPRIDKMLLNAGL